MNVVLTAPIPGKRIPSLPFGGAIFAGFSIQLPCFQAISPADDARGLEKTHTNKLVVLRTPKRRCKSHHPIFLRMSENVVAKMPRIDRLTALDYRRMPSHDE